VPQFPLRGRERACGFRNEFFVEFSHDLFLLLVTECEEFFNRASLLCLHLSPHAATITPLFGIREWSGMNDVECSIRVDDVNRLKESAALHSKLPSASSAERREIGVAGAAAAAEFLLGLGGVAPVLRCRLDHEEQQQHNARQDEDRTCFSWHTHRRHRYHETHSSAARTSVAICDPSRHYKVSSCV